MAYAIMRMERLKTTGSVMAARSHDLRLSDVPNADPSKGFDVIADLDPEGWRSLINGTRHRSDAVLAYDIVLTFSGTGPDGWKPTDQVLADWKQKNLQWLSDTFGQENIRVAVLHQDETTPHIQALVTPIETKTNKKGKSMTSFNARKWTGDKRALNKLQDAYAAAMRPFGLQRGLSGSKARHTDIQVFYDQVNKTITEQELEPRVIQEKGFIKTTEREETASEYLARTGVREKAGAYILEKRRGADRDKQLAYWKSEADRLRDIPLGQVMEDLGFQKDVKQSGAWGQVYHTAEGKVVVKDQKFYDFHGSTIDPGTGKPLGGGSIDLVMHLEGVDFKGGVSILRGLYGEDKAAGALTRHYANRAEGWVKNTQPTTPRKLDEPDPSKLQRVKDYLAQDRGISPEAVDYLIMRGDLYANRHGSAVFVHRDPAGQVKGVTVRGTRGSFKQSQGDKKGAWFQYGDPLASARAVILTESPIDALSYATVHPVPENTCIVSLGGHAISQELEAALKGKRVVIALDNPEQERNIQSRSDGEKALQGIRKRLPFAEVQVPAGGKDWNEELTRQRDRQAASERQTRELNRQRPGVVVGPMNRAPGSGSPRP